ncbi:MAG TPA: alpha-(1-_3)-arabinofuranosyltransferase family protein [Streptosporangiaceae bacterium]|nr:alpha-(1->3)-arabinofuranosyltransferase family protein [Streptosporangiaceae bacterium]
MLGQLPSYPLLACGLVLTLLPFVTAPGRIISDTKFELAVNPSGFLSGALTLWDPQQFGGLLNQAVGYLFPMGPFFELLKLLAVPGWIAQRLWLAGLLLAAFGGTALLAGRLGIGTPRTRLAAGLAYALSPAALSMIGQTSGEFLPMAMLPWIILPLTDMHPWVSGAGGRPGVAGRARAVARSAVAVALCSGMNAASTAAVLLPAVIYILTRPGIRSRARLLGWWLPAVALVSSSWSIPLVLLSKYGVSIVPFTESAQVTSSTTSLLNIFRGTESWIGYQAVNGQPGRPLAFQLATSLLPAVLTGLLAALGLAGLVQIRERRFLLWSALGGVVIMSLGYASGLGSPLEHQLIGLVNGPAAPFRNLWKFDPMLRLPLALGFAHLMAAARVPQLRAALVAAAALCLGGVATLGFATGLASPGSFGQLPAYWVSAADWVTAHAGNQAVLVEPGSQFGSYLWGAPMDDVLQALTTADYAERNLGVVGSVGNERLLNAIDQQLAAGEGSAGLAEVLARMGVKYVLVRNDLSGSALDGTWPARVQDALAASPGLTLAAQFGPPAGRPHAADAVSSFRAPYPAVQVYQVAGAEPTAVVQPATDTLRVYGAPESELTLAGEGLLGQRPVLLNSDGAAQPVAGSVVTDSLRRRVVNFGELRTNFSPTLTGTQPADTFLSADDYTAPAWGKDQAVARYAGIRNVTASSAGSDITTFASQWATGALPYAAMDGNLATMWESGSFDGPLGQWIRVDFDSAVNPGTIMVAFADNAAIGPPVTQVTVATAAGKFTEAVQDTGKLQPLQVPPGASAWLRLTVTGLGSLPSAPRLGTQVGVAEIDVPGVSASRTIVAPPAPGPDPSAVVLAKAQPYQSGCMLTSQRWVCSPKLEALTEEEYGFSHAFDEPAAEPGTLRGSAILLNSSLADHDAVVGRDQPVATASSTYTADPQDQPMSAFDGDPATAWIASPADPAPALTIRWGRRRTVSGITIERPPGASGLTQVLITGSRGQRRGAMIGASGAVRFAPMLTTKLTIAFTTDRAPLQVSDVVIPGVPLIRVPAARFRLPCGLGPRVAVNGRAVPTRVSGTFADLLNDAPVQFTACRRVALAAGANQVTEPHSDAFDVQDVVIGAVPAGHAAAASAGPTPPAATVRAWTSSVRTLRVTAAARSYLEVNENFNAGWQAVLAGHRLQPVQLDGWKQAWVLPAGSAGLVTLTYQPESLYRDAVAGGLVVLALIMAIALRLRLRRAPPARAWSAPDRHRRRPGSRRLRPPGALRWLRTAALVAAGTAALSGAGLMLGGYRGALAVPAMAGALGALARTWPRTSAAWLLGGLLLIAAVVGAVGQHLVFAGEAGRLVSLLSNVIPQFICLIVVGGMAGVLLSPEREPEA